MELKQKSKKPALLLQRMPQRFVVHATSSRTFHSALSDEKSEKLRTNFGLRGLIRVLSKSTNIECKSFGPFTFARKRAAEEKAQAKAERAREKQELLAQEADELAKLKVRGSDKVAVRRTKRVRARPLRGLLCAERLDRLRRPQQTRHLSN